MGDLFFAEVVAEPRDALREAQAAHRGVSHRPAAVPAGRLRKNLPKLWQIFAFRDELGAGDSSRRALDQSTGNAATGNRANRSIVGGEVAKLRDVDAGEFSHNSGCFRTL